MKIQLLYDHAGFRAGEITEVPEADAVMYEERGVAIVLDRPVSQPPPAPTIKPAIPKPQAPPPQEIVKSGVPFRKAKGK